MLELADRFRAGPNVDRELRTYLARGYAQIATAIPADQAERVQTALVKSVDAVRTAIKEGFRDRVYLETEPDLGRYATAMTSNSYSMRSGRRTRRRRNVSNIDWA